MSFRTPRESILSLVMNIEIGWISRRRQTRDVNNRMGPGRRLALVGVVWNGAANRSALFLDVYGEVIGMGPCYFGTVRGSPEIQGRHTGAPLRPMKYKIRPQIRFVLSH